MIWITVLILPARSAANTWPLTHDAKPGCSHQNFTDGNHYKHPPGHHADMGQDPKSGQKQYLVRNRVHDLAKITDQTLCFGQMAIIKIRQGSDRKNNYRQNITRSKTFVPEEKPGQRPKQCVTGLKYSANSFMTYPC